MKKTIASFLVGITSMLPVLALAQTSSVTGTVFSTSSGNTNTTTTITGTVGSTSTSTTGSNNGGNTNWNTNGWSYSTSTPNGTSTFNVTVGNGNTNCIVIRQNLSIGATDVSTGGAITQLQNFLNEQGFNVSAVGRFGPQTKAALQHFQQAHGITATGNLGPMTREAILKIRCSDVTIPQIQKGIQTAQAVALDQTMRKLWEDHITWTRLYIVESAAGLPGASTTAVRLLQNQQDIGNAIKPYYGEAAGNQLTSLLNTHIKETVNVLNAAKAGDEAALASAKTAWYDNANQIATFLSTTNPTSWPLVTMQKHMKDHLDILLDQAVHQIRGNYPASVADYDAAHLKILMLADTLAKGIVAQFPNQFQQ